MKRRISRWRNGFQPQVHGLAVARFLWTGVFVSAVLSGVACSDGARSLRRAAARGRKSRVQKLIASGAPIDAKDDNGDTALHLGVLGNHAEVVDALLASGAAVDSKNKCGWTPLHRAMSADIASRLLRAGADPDARDSVDGSTPLRMLVDSDHGRPYVAQPGSRQGRALLLVDRARRRKLAEMLLTTGADINARTDDGWTPLHGAVAAGHLDDVTFLLQKGADPFAQTELKTTPLQLAVSSGKTAIARLLKDHIAELQAEESGK